MAVPDFACSITAPGCGYMMTSGGFPPSMRILDCSSKSADASTSAL